MVDKRWLGGGAGDIIFFLLNSVFTDSHLRGVSLLSCARNQGLNLTVCTSENLRCKHAHTTSTGYKSLGAVAGCVYARGKGFRGAHFHPPPRTLPTSPVNTISARKRPVEATFLSALNELALDHFNLNFKFC